MSLGECAAVALRHLNNRCLNEWGDLGDDEKLKRSSRDHCEREIFGTDHDERERTVKNFDAMFARLGKRLIDRETKK